MTRQKVIEPQKRLQCFNPFIGRLRPPPDNDSQAATKVATPEPTESEPKESESEPKEAEGSRNLINNKPISSDSDVTGDVVNDNPSHTFETTKMAPNRLINWNNLKSTVDSHLSQYSGCTSKVLYLAEKSTGSFASSLEIVCKVCDETQGKNRLELRYFKKKIANTVPKNKEERRDLCALKLKRDHQIHTMKYKILPRR